MTGSIKAGSETAYQKLEEQRDAVDREAKSTSVRSSGFNSFGAIYASVLFAIVGTVYLAVAQDLPWVWWLPVYIGIGLVSFLVLFGLVSLKKD